MAGAPNKSINNNGQFNPYLSPTQQDLLIAALASSNPAKPNSFSAATNGKKDMNKVERINTADMNASLFDSPQQPTPGSGNFGSIDEMEDSPFIDYLDTDANFDFEPIEGEDMIGDLPGGSSSNDADGDLHEKRKSIGDDGDDEDGGGKRREGDDKTAKKPGRKPLTSEPTTKRKAQNRAAQRAFRERKEKHLKDLETKVNELEKESETKNHENGLLRAQVARLQIELREYRKRLSLNSTGINRSPPISGVSNLLPQKKTNNPSNGFEFEFPRFGGLPGAHIFNNGALGKDTTNTSATRSPPTTNGATAANGVLSRQDSTGRSMSPKSQTNGTASATHSPPVTNGLSNGSSQNGVQNQQKGSVDDLASLFSPSILKSVSNDSSFSYFPSTNNATSQQDNSSNENSIGSTSRIFRFNSTPSNTASPSDSTTSQYNANSSYGTSPEPSHNSPANKASENIMADASIGGYVCYGNSEGEVAFCEMLNMACGNPRNPVPRAKSQSQSNGTPALPTQATLNNSATTIGGAQPAAKSPASDVNGIDWLANQNGGQFDPTLFGDYRESQDAIVGDGDFTGGFFSDAFNLPDFATPPAVGQDSISHNLIDEIEKTQDGVDEEEVVPGEDPNQMLNCNKIWNQLQDRSDFQEGSFDIEGLCSELRAKARCSETGVVVDKKDVDAALMKLPQRP
ncbi:MAG: DNA-binding transcription factor yap1 [Bogoriella megaspora]|nr:MAG: DNA-binding transcription factor yap1 [Bogoriella megaspora]